MVNIENQCSIMGYCIDFLHTCRCKEFSPAAMSDCRRVPICGLRDAGRAEEDGRMADGEIKSQHLTILPLHVLEAAVLP